ncbi:porin [Blastopirellula marina]|uniref:Porin n=2 Tax=Blastopirellula marina TaxID=124 RepID=A0A2S8FLR4_9BACT|nr:porin [Blastopirellula marina]PTL43273.1 porin [Blastopirellula marina]
MVLASPLRFRWKEPTNNTDGFQMKMFWHVKLLSMLALLCIGAPLVGQDLQPDTDIEWRLSQLENEIQMLRTQVETGNQPGMVPAQEAGWVIGNNGSLVPCIDCPPGAAKKYPTVQLTGFFHLDGVYFNQNQANRTTLGPSGDLQDGWDFRRARLAAKGELAENFSYIMEFDFASSQATFVDVWAQYSNAPIFQNIRIGRWRQPYGMSELTSIRELPFLERSSGFAVAPFRQTGLGFFGSNEPDRVTWAASVFRYPSDGFGDNAGDNGGYAGAGRLTVLPVYTDDGERLIHMGFDYYYANPSQNSIRFASQPEIQVVDVAPNPSISVPPFVDTGNVPVDHVDSLNFELAAKYGRFVIQSEARWTRLNQRGNGPTEVIENAYVLVRYSLTGESLKYNKKNAVFGRVVPIHDFNPYCGYWGAWELAARYSYADFNGDWLAASGTPGPGRQMGDTTLGLNWYLNANTKFQFNYIYSDLNDPTYGSSFADVYAVRCQIDY